mgnify:CR=1 FL=1
MCPFYLRKSFRVYCYDGFVSWISDELASLLERFLRRRIEDMLLAEVGGCLRGVIGLQRDIRFAHGVGIIS